MPHFWQQTTVGEVVAGMAGAGECISGDCIAHAPKDAQALEDIAMAIAECQAEDDVTAPHCAASFWFQYTSI